MLEGGSLAQGLAEGWRLHFATKTSPLVLNGPHKKLLRTSVSKWQPGEEAIIACTRCSQQTVMLCLGNLHAAEQQSGTLHSMLDFSPAFEAVCLVATLLPFGSGQEPVPRGCTTSVAV